MTERNRKFDEFTAKIKHKAKTLKTVLSSLKLSFGEQWAEIFIELKYRLEQHDTEKAGGMGEIFAPMQKATIETLDEIINDMPDYDPAEYSWAQNTMMLDILNSLRTNAENLDRLLRIMDKGARNNELKRAKEQKGIYSLKDRVAQAKARSKGNGL